MAGVHHRRRPIDDCEVTYWRALEVGIVEGLLLFEQLVKHIQPEHIGPLVRLFEFTCLE